MSDKNPGDLLATAASDLEAASAALLRGDTYAAAIALRATGASLAKLSKDPATVATFGPKAGK